TRRPEQPMVDPLHHQERTPRRAILCQALHITRGLAVSIEVQDDLQVCQIGQSYCKSSAR
ncbi:hypothetical protein GE21DRAFT_1222669, partial [Neurospora crassa]